MYDHTIDIHHALPSMTTTPNLQNHLTFPASAAHVQASTSILAPASPSSIPPHPAVSLVTTTLPVPPLASSKKSKKLPYRKNSANPEWQKAASLVPKVHSVTSWDIREINLDDVATGFVATFDRCLEVLKNGRAFSPWGEEMCGAIGQVVLHSHRDVKGSDGLSPEGKKTSIKSLTSNRGLVFQMSVYTGAKRSCSMADLELSIRDSPIHIVVDITDLSCIRLVALPAELLLDWMKVGLLTPSGFPTADEFYDLLTLTVASGQSIEVDTKALTENLKEANAKKFADWKLSLPKRPALFDSVPASPSPQSLAEAAQPAHRAQPGAPNADSDEPSSTDTPKARTALRT